MAVGFPTEPQPLQAIGLLSVGRPAFDPRPIMWLEGRSVVRCSEQLRLHRALDDIGWTGMIDELDGAVRLRNHSMPDQVLITTSGTILAGFGIWRLAILEGRHTIHCIEYLLDDDAALEFILSYQKPRRVWNAFVRTCLALTLEPHLQQRALENMRTGGKYKGSASLPDLRPIDVREAIAAVAGVGARSVSNVKTILKLVHPRLIAALRDGTLTINGAMQLCKVPRGEQLQQFILRSEERAISNVIRRAIPRPKQEKASPNLFALLDALRRQEARHPGSVVVQVGQVPRTVVLIGQDLLTGPHSQREWNLT
jgi:hypothetical protein